MFVFVYQERMSLSITPSGVRTFFASGGHCNNTRDTQEHILLTGFMKKMQYNALNIKTVANKFGFTLFAELRDRDIRELSRIFKLFRIPPQKSRYPKKYLPKFSHPKKFRNRKFQPLKNPSIFPVT